MFRAVMAAVAFLVERFKLVVLVIVLGILAQLALFEVSFLALLASTPFLLVGLVALLIALGYGIAFRDKARFKNAARVTTSALIGALALVPSLIWMLWVPSLEAWTRPATAILLAVAAYVAHLLSLRKFNVSERLVD